MAAPIPPKLEYSNVYNLLIFPPILIKLVSKFIVCKVLYFKAQSLLRLCSPLKYKLPNHYREWTVSMNSKLKVSNCPTTTGNVDSVYARVLNFHLWAPYWD